MAIEFRCTQCGKLLRTADGTAGKQAKCPSCGTVVTIPEASSAETYGVSPPLPPQGPEAVTPPAMGDNPYASPRQPAIGSAAATNVSGNMVPARIDIGDVLSRTWTIFKDQLGICIGAAMVATLINVGVQMGVQMAIRIGASIFRDAPIVIFLAVIGAVVNVSVATWIGAGQAHLFLRVARGERPEFSELFSGARWFWKILGASILFGLITLFGLFFFIVPGVIAALMFSKYYMLIIDRDMAVMDSLDTSRTLTAGNMLTLFLIGLVLLALKIAATIPCCLGFIVLAPYTALLSAVVYLAMTGQPTAADRTA